MSEERFDLIFRGDIVLGRQIADVKQRLAQLFKTDPSKIDSLFTGRAMPLKRNLDRPTADKYKAVLLKAGAEVEVCPAGTVKAGPRPASKVASRPAGSMTLQERLEAAGAARQEAHRHRQEKQRALQESSGTEEGLVLAPLGADVLSDTERKQFEPVAVDTSGLRVTAMDGDLLSDDEKVLPVVVELDLSEFELAPVGEELVRADERLPLPEVTVDTRGLDLAEVGEELLHADERKTAPPVAVDTRGLNIAPVGSDMGQAAKPLPPPPPDTSGISLAE